MRQIEKEERLLFDDLVLSDDELFLVRGGATRSCGSIVVVSVEQLW